MEKYYFIGKGNAVTAEIIEILKKCGIAYEQVPKGKYGIYSVSQEQVNSVISQGKKPYLVALFSARDGAVNIPNYKVNCNCSALLYVAKDCGVELSNWQNLVLANDENMYNKYPYDVNHLAELVRMGYSKHAIEKVREFDRIRSGVTLGEDQAAKECINQAMQQNKLLIVDNLPHEKFKAVTDRVFWLQNVQNVVIFTTVGTVLYAGFADVAFGLFKNLGGHLSYAFWEGSYKTNEEKNKILKLLTLVSKKKVQGGVL